MKQDVRLYISNKLVDFSSELSMPFTYQLKDVNNPTIVKNPFTKTITIIGTKNNNAIFGDIYNLDREQLFDATKLVGAYFNPSIRTPFSIYRNGELIESGYMQLNSVTIQNKVVNYEITLYGGLGDFFYSLMYNENNEPLTLADLTYGVEDEQTGLPFENPDDEMNFTINKEFVYGCFQNVGKDNNNTINDYITFVPSYNGLPENFDSDKVLINTDNNSYWSGKTSTTVDGKTYTPYNNYVLAQLPRKYNEWEILDLRSYLQRPAIKLSKIIDACTNPINNGGYSVELDPDFFNVNNPYYNDAWVALPLLTNLEKEKNNITSADGELYDTNLWVGKNGGTTYISKTSKLIPTSDFTISGSSINYSSTPVGTLTNLEVEFDINYFTDNMSNSELFIGSTTYQYNDEYGATTYYGSSSSLIVQLIAYDAEGKIMSYSNVFAIGSKYWGSSKITNSNYKNYWKNYSPIGNPTINWVDGVFVLDGDKYKFETNSGGNTKFNLKLENIPYSTKISLEVRISRVLDKPPFSIPTVYDYGTLTNNNIYNSVADCNNGKVTGYFQPTFNKIIITRDEPDSIVASNSKITKQFLLKTEKTPADYLLGYCKMFDLHFQKDSGEKIIKILTRNNFYNGNIIDWNDKIDYSKEFKIKPLMFDKKFYTMKLDAESYYLKKYKNEYSVEYGQKRIDTNYNFNNETVQLLDGLVYQNAVSALDTSPYYHTFYDKDNRLLAPFCNSNFEYSLFNVSSSNVVEATEVNYTTPAIVGGWSWNRNSGYDSFAKTCFYNLENDEKSLSDISSVLLFYNGQVEPKDFDGNRIRYKLTDDLSEMYLLNNKTPCWLFSDYDYTTDFQIITYDCTTLPQFLRYKIVGNQVQASWDFGKPKEVFFPNITYEDNTTIYSQYWTNYYNDALDINTKEVTCYVNLNDVNVNSELLRNFYYFNGCYWILNKVENFNINNFETTKCQFIKVNELTNYKYSYETETAQEISVVEEIEEEVTSEEGV